MPPVPHGRSGSRPPGPAGAENGRTRRAWVVADGARPVILATPLNGKKVSGYGSGGRRQVAIAPQARPNAAGRKKGPINLTVEGLQAKVSVARWRRYSRGSGKVRGGSAKLTVDNLQIRMCQ
jgi:hypothetical protein